MGRSTRRGLMVCIASVVSVVAAVPTQAGELTEWSYDSQTRSLKVVLPNTVAPAISVLTPTQLLLALPDTQMGDVVAQTVDDGVVESIVLTQATPDTVWMVVEFAAGSVLADVQNATQTVLAGEDLRQWQIRPALESLPGAINAVANQSSPPLVSTDGMTSTGADSLRPIRKISQSPDFPDLPVLEPALPAGESVSVPRIEPGLEPAIPIRPAPVQVSVPQPSEQTEINQPLDEVVPTVGVSPIAIPVLSDVEPLVSDQPVVDRDEFDEVAADEITTEEVILDEVAIDERREEVALSEPPFVGGEGGDTPTDSATILNSDRLPAPRPAAAAAPVVQTPTLKIPAVEIPAVEIPAVEIPAVDVLAVESPAAAGLTPSVSPNRVNRWPEPVPFGQPLPETRQGG